MKSRRSRVMTVTAVIVSAGMALAMSPAAAKPRPTPTPQEQAKVYDRMLTRADVPRSLRVAPGIEYTMKDHAGQHQSLCDKNGRDIQGRETDLLFQVELGETDVDPDPTALEQKVWPYPSAQAALRAWQYLERQVKLCSGRSQWRGETGGTNVQYLSNGRTTERVDGRTGIWVWIDARGAVRNPESEDGGYYVLHLVKDTIQSLEYDYPDQRGLPAAARSQVDRLSWRLAQRWLSTY